MKRLLLAACVMGCMFFLAQDCFARRWEVSLMAGYAMGGSFEEEAEDSDDDISLSLEESPSFAVAIDTDYEQGTELEIYYSYQPTELQVDEGTFSNDTLFDVDIHYLQIGGTVILTKMRDFDGETLFKDNGFCDPYIVGGLGVTHISPRDSDYDPITRASASLGLGTRLHLTSRLGIRLEARGFATFIGSSTAVFTNSQGMHIYVNSSGFGQALLSAGLFYNF